MPAADSFAADSLAAARSRSARLGHYLGTLTNRVRLQRAGVEVFLVIADYRVITDRDGVGQLSANVRELVLDYLAAGIDPDAATIFTHSAVPALNQLMLPFLSLVTVAGLRRNPAVKAETAADRPLSGLLLTHPVHQAADILFCHGNLVPAGKDQLPQVEAARLIARRFNERYGRGQAAVRRARGPARRRARATGDRRREDEQEPRPGAPARGRQPAAGRGPVHRRRPRALADAIGGRGAATLKAVVTEAVNEHLCPLRERRAALAADPGHVRAVLTAGNARANAVAEDTPDEVRRVMDIAG